jgi:hypothetical protein
MDTKLPVEIVTKLMAAIPEGETLVGLSLRELGEIRTRYLGWPEGWASGIVEIEVQTYAVVDGAQGTKTWKAFRSGDGYALRLDGFRAEMPLQVIGTRHATP